MKTAETILELLSSKNTVATVKDWLQKNKGRSALAQHLCRALNITDHLGKPRIAGVHVGLRILESRGFWKLPKLRSGIRAQQQPRRLNTAVPAPNGVPAQVEEVRGLRLVEVSAGEDELYRTWNELMLTEHPLKDCRLVGRQLRYLIGSDHGWLGAIGFGSCALHLRVRDEWIGWDSSTRKSFQERLINMTRFLIRPQVRCQNLASRVLSLCLERVGSDFAARYGFEPWLLESFVDTEQHLGTSYQAANWLPIGTTAGLGRNAHGNRPTKTPKAVYVYELTQDWRSHMGLPPRSEKIKPVSLEEHSRKQFDHLDALPAMGQARIEVPRQREKKSKPSKPGRIALPARTAHVDLKWDKVTLSPPATPQTRDLQPIEIYALSVVERHPPEGAKALRWVLLTTVPICSRKEALRCLRWYTMRWRIEEWHRVLKSGCHIESHQHRTADRMARAICIDAVIAWRVMLLALLGREIPEMPCELLFSTWECTLLERLQPLVAPETMTGKKNCA
jgi:hypothetical protein